MNMYTTSATIISLLKKHSVRELTKILKVTPKTLEKMRSGKIAMGESTYLMLIVNFPQWEGNVDYLDKNMAFYDYLPTV